MRAFHKMKRERFARTVSFAVAVFIRESIMRISLPRKKNRSENCWKKRVYSLTELIRLRAVRAGTVTETKWNILSAILSRTAKSRLECIGRRILCPSLRLTAASW